MSSLTLTLWSWKIWLSKRRKLVVVGLVALGLVFWLTFSGNVDKLRNEINNLRAIPCEDSDAKEILMEICSLYKRKALVGELCHPLCVQKRIEFVKCLNYKNGKYVVQVECKDVCKRYQRVPAVLKMTRIDASKLTRHMDDIGRQLLMHLHIQPDTGKLDIYEPMVTAESLSLLTSELLDTEYGFTPRDDGDPLSLLWGETYSSFFQETKTNLCFARSYWSVVNQNEYRISQVFKEWDVFPKIYGSCGPLYLAEHAPELKSLRSIFPFLNSEFPSWQKRAKLAIEILNLVQKMDNMEYPLHLCDIKSPHFGYTQENTVRFIDSDTVFADKTISRDLGAPNCTQHEDCAFFDCEGWCNKEKRKCTPVRTNNNLQTVCAKVFKGSAFSAYSGLLSTPPKALAAKLTSLINSCANDVTEHSGEIPMKKPDQTVLSALQRYLLESLNADVI